MTDAQVYQENLKGYVDPNAPGSQQRTGLTNPTRQARLQAEGILSGTGEGFVRTAFREAFKNPFGGGIMEGIEIASGQRKMEETNVLLDVNSDAIANAAAERNRKQQLALGIKLMGDMGLMRFFQ